MRSGSLTKLLLMVVGIAVLSVAAYNPIARNINLGLDLQGGLRVVLQGKPTETAQVTADSIQRTKDVIENRINSMGVKEPIVQTAGTDRIIVELAGVKDPEEAVRMIGKTASLKFKTEDGKTVLTGEDIKDAFEQLNPNGQPEVVLSFTPSGTKKFGDVTSRNIGKTIAITLDEKQVSRPVVNAAITAGNAVISGGYKSLEEARADAMLIKGGALPINLEMIEKRVVGPSLGKDSLEKSKVACIYGGLAVLIFMLGFYRLPGLIANIALVAYTVLELGSLAILGATLTLPGIAGILLSIGMAVDANVIIFARIKEELHEGLPLGSAIDKGFDMGFSTVLDANATTLIAAAVLYFLGTSSIKGFAVTLFIGNILSMFTAVTLTRWMLKWTSGVVRNLKLYGA